MTTSASMGGPLSEAELIAEIRAHLVASGEINNEHNNIAWLSSRVGVLEGQLATARALHQPLVVDWSTSPKCKASHGVAWVNWPCPDAVALGLDGGGSDAN